MTDSVEEIAEGLAAHGREALVERLRTAYAEAAAAHSDIIVMDDDRIEALVQRSADKADGLQWRRALATVASERLDISLTDALSHPAVARAQELVGAPSYEDSLAELTRRPVPVASPPAEADPSPMADPGPAADLVAPEPIAEEPVPADPEPEDETLTPVATVDEVEVLDPEPDDVTPEPEPELIDASPIPDPEPSLAAAPSSPLRVTAIHLGGVANLPAAPQGVELRVSDDGLDILQGDDEILGRLAWQDIDALEVPAPRSRRRRREGRARLVVRTQNGDASFEIPAFSSDELRERLDPLVERFGHN